VEAYDITWAELLIKVYTSGFSISSSEGPGSATPKGKSLFATDHDVNGVAYNNVITPSSIDYDNADRDVAIAS
jgi:hypothetical protein